MGQIKAYPTSGKIKSMSDFRKTAICTTLLSYHFRAGNARYVHVVKRLDGRLNEQAEGTFREHACGVRICSGAG